MNTWLKRCFFAGVVRPFLTIALGLNVRHRERLPAAGPAILAANHNSHLDTLVLMSLFPLGVLPLVRPIAASDYFLRNRMLAWISLNLIGILPIDRSGQASRHDPLAPVCAALEQKAIVILFPEGSRGQPERLGEFRTGIAHLARRYPDVPIHPVFLHGLGKALPKGEAVLVPFFCDVFVGEPLYWSSGKVAFMDDLSGRMAALAAEGQFPEWE